MTIPATSIAVTGVGAIIGQGIVRSLRATKRELSIIGIDRNDRSPGSYMVDHFAKKPSVSEDSKEYLQYWEELINKHKICLVMPGLEVDMLFFNKHREWFNSHGVMLVLNQSSLIDISENKWRFAEELISMGYPVIPSIRAKNWSDALKLLGEPPILLKPLCGNGSRGIVLLEDEGDFNYWSKKADYEWMLQRIVGSLHEEYTVGVFGLGDGDFVGPLIFRRRLSAAGNTQEAEVVQSYPLLESAIRELCMRFLPLGPTNLQFRVEDDTAFLLEINPRFSSSNSLRTAFGFNEAEMSIDFYLDGKLPEAPKITEGVGWRYSEDYVIYASHSI